jgi:hypothetical protein
VGLGCGKFFRASAKIAPSDSPGLCCSGPTGGLLVHLVGHVFGWGSALPVMGKAQGPTKRSGASGDGDRNSHSALGLASVASGGRDVASNRLASMTKFASMLTTDNRLSDVHVTSANLNLSGPRGDSRAATKGTSLDFAFGVSLDHLVGEQTHLRPNRHSPKI